MSVFRSLFDGPFSVWRYLPLLVSLLLHESSDTSWRVWKSCAVLSLVVRKSSMLGDRLAVVTSSKRQLQKISYSENHVWGNQSCRDRLTVLGTCSRLYENECLWNSCLSLAYLLTLTLLLAYFFTFTCLFFTLICLFSDPNLLIILPLIIFSLSIAYFLTLTYLLFHTCLFFSPLFAYFLTLSHLLSHS